MDNLSQGRNNEKTCKVTNYLVKHAAAIPVDGALFIIL